MSYYSTYRTCAVPLCSSTTKKYPNKLFIYVPKLKKIRQKWLNLARMEINKLSYKATMHFCEDHFNLPNDMENYIRYSIMGRVKIRMKPNCLPSKFSCQPDRIKRTTSYERPSSVKRQRKAIVKEAEEAFICNQSKIAKTDINVATTSTIGDKPPCDLPRTNDNSHEQFKIKPSSENQCVKGALKPKFPSEATLCCVTKAYKSTTPIETHSKSIAVTTIIITGHTGLKGKIRLNFTPPFSQRPSSISKIAAPAIQSPCIKISSESDEQCDYEKNVKTKLEKIRLKINKEELSQASLQNTET